MSARVREITTASAREPDPAILRQSYDTMGTGAGDASSWRLTPGISCEAPKFARLRELHLLVRRPRASTYCRMDTLAKKAWLVKDPPPSTRFNE